MCLGGESRLQISDLGSQRRDLSTLRIARRAAGLL
jgi:hypothetical protein